MYGHKTNNILHKETYNIRIKETYKPIVVFLMSSELIVYFLRKKYTRVKKKLRNRPFPTEKYNFFFTENIKNNKFAAGITLYKLHFFLDFPF